MSYFTKIISLFLEKIATILLGLFTEKKYMMFMLNSSLALQIIALVASAFLLSWGLYKKGDGTGVAKFIGFITTVIALFSLVTSLYFAAKFWQESKAMRNTMHSSMLPPPPTPPAMDKGNTSKK
jgi:hypothetical protein